MVDWSNHVREVCSFEAIQKTKKLVDRVNTVQTDFVKMVKMKYNRVRVILGKLIFEGIQTDTKEMF
jgi:hypothetical protein